MGNSNDEPLALDSGQRLHATTPSEPANPLSTLAPVRKNTLYAVLCVSVSTHALSACCLVTSIQIIAHDMHLGTSGNAIWLVSATAMAFAACIPLGGRLADVFPPQWCFVIGSLGMTSFALGNSFGKPNLPLGQEEISRQVTHGRNLPLIIPARAYSRGQRAFLSFPRPPRSMCSPHIAFRFVSNLFIESWSSPTYDQAFRVSQRHDRPHVSR